MGLMKTLSQSSKELKDILDRLTALESGETFVTKETFDSLNASVNSLDTKLNNLSIESKSKITKTTDRGCKYEFFKTFIKEAVDTVENGNATYVTGTRKRFGDWVVDVNINNSGDNKYLEIYSEIDMGENDEIFLSVFASSTSQNTVLETDNPFKEYDNGLPLYLKGNTLNGASALTFMPDAISARTVLGKIKLPTDNARTYYNIELTYMKVTY